MSEFKLRGSAMGGFADCARRAAFRQFAPIIVEKTGIEQKPRIFSRQARVGHAVHKRLELLLIAKDRGEQPDAELIDTAVGEVLVTGPEQRYETDEIEPAWDGLPENDEIDSLETAQKMIGNMSDALKEAVEAIDPAAIEPSISALIEGVEVSAHPDWLTRDHKIGDLKSHKGTEPKNYIAQFGTSAAILKEIGEEVTGLQQFNIQRLKTKQSPLRIVEYDVKVATKYARTLIGRTANNLEAFIDSGDPESFNANPQSPLCSPRWCDAWGTEWCKVHKQQ